MPQDFKIFKTFKVNFKQTFSELPIAIEISPSRNESNCVTTLGGLSPLRYGNSLLPYDLGLKLRTL